MQMMPRMIEIMNYIQANYIDVTLDDLAEKFYLSKPYISKYIKEKSGSDIWRAGKENPHEKSKSITERAAI